MNVYFARGYRPSWWNSEPDELDESLCVVANTESEALGFVLEQFQDSAKKDWEIFKVNLEKSGVFGYD